RVADDNLDLRHQPVDLDVGDHPAEAVSGRDHRFAAVTAEPVDLGRRHEATVPGVALGADAALAVPATERVHADPESLRRLARAVEVLWHPSSYAVYSSIAADDSS